MVTGGSWDLHWALVGVMVAGSLGPPMGSTGSDNISVQDL